MSFPLGDCLVLPLYLLKSAVSCCGMSVEEQTERPRLESGRGGAERGARGPSAPRPTAGATGCTEAASPRVGKGWRSGMKSLGSVKSMFL